ncbi:MAG: glycine zipper 2TM domain-containing protein [Planctomycetes bacterium]|nr:glycine zipper 2TM domain-containing protein [Planctomycetota bacterium]MBL7042867.1 glycine zipper 2TM domain-containing protein [Pirellulaceae bacterium]
MKARCLCVALLVLPALGCQSSNYAERGTAVGALTGALAGAAIGKNNGKTGAGAVIGTAVGALAGTAIGEGIDADIARNNAIIQERLGRQLAGAVTAADVIVMTQASLSDDVIITHIQANGVANRPRPEDLITLSNAGVSDAVIKSMQTVPPPTAALPSSPAPRPAPVIIEEHHYIAPSYPRPYRSHGHYHGPPRRHGSNVHWGFSFSN